MEDKQAELKEESKDVSVPTPFPVPAENKESKRGFSGWLNILAAPISAAVGLLYARNHSRQASLDRHKRHGMLDEEYKIVNADWKKAEGSVLAEISKHGEGDMKPELKTANKNFTKNVNTYFEKRGFKNWVDHFRGLSPQGKTDILEKTAAVTVVTLGALLTIANSKSIFGSKSEDAKDSGISK